MSWIYCMQAKIIEIFRKCQSEKRQAVILMLPRFIMDTFNGMSEFGRWIVIRRNNGNPIRKISKLRGKEWKNLYKKHGKIDYFCRDNFLGSDEKNDHRWESNLSKCCPFSMKFSIYWINIYFKHNNRNKDVKI